MVEVLEVALMTFVHTDFVMVLAVAVVKEHTDLRVAVQTGVVELRVEVLKVVTKAAEVLNIVSQERVRICLVEEHLLGAHCKVTVLSELVVASYAVQLAVTTLMVEEHKHSKQTMPADWVGVVIEVDQMF